MSSLALACPRCPGPRPFLELYQPEPEDPSRLLAVCPDCRRWYFRRHPRGGRPTLVEVPDTCPEARRRAARRAHLARAAVAGRIGPDCRTSVKQSPGRPIRVARIGGSRSP